MWRIKSYISHNSFILCYSAEKKIDSSILFRRSFVGDMYTHTFKCMTKLTVMYKKIIYGIRVAKKKTAVL